MLEETNIKDLIIKIHDIARELEKSKHSFFGKDLRELADRLARVDRQYYLSEQEKFAYNYVRAINAMEQI